MAYREIKRVAGVDLADVARQYADHLAAQRETVRAREGRESYCYDSPDTIYVLSRKIDDEPTYLWESVSMPYGLPPISVTCSLRDATRNSESIDSLLRRRMRRAYREALYTSEVIPVDQVDRRGLNLQVVVMDAPRIVRV